MTVPLATFYDGVLLADQYSTFFYLTINLSVLAKIHLQFKSANGNFHFQTYEFFGAALLSGAQTLVCLPDRCLN